MCKRTAEARASNEVALPLMAERRSMVKMKESEGKEEMVWSGLVLICLHCNSLLIAEC